MVIAREFSLKGGGGSKANFSGGSDLSFGHHSLGETFVEVLGPRRATSRPKIGRKIVISPDGPRGTNGAPNCSSHHPDSSHIRFHGSTTNGMAVAAQNAPPPPPLISLRVAKISHIGP